MPAPPRLSLLLVDDDDVATEAVIRSLRRYGVDYPTVSAEDGRAALSILHGTHPQRRICRPFVVLLDLNMPRMNGFEFLQLLRSDDHLRDTVVFVLTTSGSDTDRTRAYQENIAGYMVKSAVGPQFSKLVKLLDDYHAVVQLP